MRIGGDSVFARVSVLQGDIEHIDEGIAHYQERLLPEARKLAGFKGALLLVDRKTGRNLGITLWDTERDLYASSAAANRLRAQGAQAAAALGMPVVEVYEVAVRA